jgi:AraC family transcriptional regulator of adaptative response / DNA-3-methyladenine glycosylase II
MIALDPEICRRARLARDSRFDGEFFLAVTTTGIYCRPVCPARPPREENVRYYRSAAEAAQAGYRPCLRCRPESAPLSPAWLGTDTTVRRALEMIHEGYLNEHSTAQLAGRLGLGERYLRKLFHQKLGVSPGSVARTQRLHFAQKLLLETDLPMTEVAYAAGFGSLRRFNSATRENFGCAAGDMRRQPRAAARGPGISMTLNYRPPYDIDAVMALFQRHAVEGLETADGSRWSRVLRTDNGAAAVTVSAGKKGLDLSVRLSDNRELMPVIALLRRMFDLDCQPADIADCLAADELLEPLLQQRPGIRSPVVASPFESCVRAVLGQQVSTAAAKNLCAKIVAAADSRAEIEGERVLLFPRPAELLALPDSVLRMPASRQRTLRAICEHFDRRGEDASGDLLAGLARIKGIGPWSLDLVAMRGLGDPDRFPSSDLGLLKAAAAGGIENKRSLEERSARWQPWRSYAANLLWRSLGNG